MPCFSIVSSVRSLFWGFFGYLPYTDYTTIVGNAGPDHHRTDHYITQIASELLVAVYYVVTVITLLNLMISLLVKKADEVLENEDVEWKFTRAHIYFEFFENSAAVPPPFNIIFVLTSTFRKLFSSKYTFIWTVCFFTELLILL